MSRIGFDKRIHPYQLQLRLCVLYDPEGIRVEIMQFYDNNGFEDR